MDNYKKGKSFGGGKKFGGNKGSFGGNRDGGRSFDRERDSGNRGGFSSRRGDDNRPQMHNAVCTNCGNNCEVPFRPMSGKPIFCNDCFKSKRNDSPREEKNSGFENRNSRPRFDDKKPYQGGEKDSTDYKAQFEILIAKLDKLISLLISKETKEIEIPKSEENKKMINKEVDKVSLKKIITKTINKKLTVKKSMTKKKK